LSKIRRKPLITLLLLLSCVISGVIFVATPAYSPKYLNISTGIDSLLQAEFELHLIPKKSIRKYTIPIDSNFTRNVYRVAVPPSFSKTMFHYGLHQKLRKYNIDTPTRVVFPERDMNIYIYDDKSIRSTIRLITTEPKTDD
tara:strand:- start:143 stop:565 length:423 start_codon:yes stop_codon:yes gene_type:complete